MAYQTNQVILDKKEAQTMCPVPVTNATGHFVIAPYSGVRNSAMVVTSATVVYLYDFEDDGFCQIASPALGGTFAAGACGVRYAWSITYTANGGSTSTATVALSTHALRGICVGSTIEILTGNNAGLRRKIQSFNISQDNTTAVLYFDTPMPNAVADTDTFRLSTGRFFVLNAYTSLVANVFKCYDVGTMSWQASLERTGLPASWGTAGQMIAPYGRLEVFATGTATSGSATTLVNSAKDWTANQWIGYQVRITEGTGRGQVRVITANDATSLTFDSGATIDNTSEYSIEGNEDRIYLLGNNAVTMYAYTISTNSWATISPSVARAAAPSLGCSGDWIGRTGDTGWGNENTIQDGRYIYSFRGGATAMLHRYSIPTNAWETVTYNGIDTFTTGSSYAYYNDNIYIQQNSTGRMFEYNVSGNYTLGFFTETYTQSTAREGAKMWIKLLDEEGSVVWLYYILNNLTAMRRIMVY